jgi:NAD(P)-dependent dehydrogenase (short-subunit alcohol dehydrogenase family)
MSRNLLDFSGQVVLITGARSGIGQATAVLFAEQGASLVLAGRSHADETMDRIKAVGGEAIFVKADVSVASDVKNIVKTTVDTYGKLDVAFNNAGLLPITANLADQTLEDFDKIIAADLKGVFLCMKYEIPEMLKNGGGAIINTGSVVSIVADPGMAPYVAAKHGVAGLTRAAGQEYIKDNIRINLIAPGFTATEMTAGWMADPAMKELVKSFNAANRIADPHEIAGIVLFLASPLASFIAGGIYPVDAAQTAH